MSFWQRMVSLMSLPEIALQTKVAERDAEKQRTKIACAADKTAQNLNAAGDALKKLREKRKVHTHTLLSFVQHVNSVSERRVGDRRRSSLGN